MRSVTKQLSQLQKQIMEILYHSNKSSLTLTEIKNIYEKVFQPIEYFTLWRSVRRLKNRNMVTERNQLTGIGLEQYSVRRGRK